MPSSSWPSIQLAQSRGTGFGRRAATILGIVIVQAGLGIATILTGVPLWLALLHQFVAIGLLSHAVLNLRSMMPARSAASPVAA